MKGRRCVNNRKTKIIQNIFFGLPGKPKLLGQNACGTSFQKSLYPSTLLSGCDNGQVCCLLG
jgi:hypothetical protein